MRAMIDIPDTLDPNRYEEVLKKINEIHNIVYGTSREIGFHAQTTAENSEAKKSKQDGLPEMSKLEEDRDNEITKILKSCQGPADARTRLAKTCYKNLTKIYGIVWEQSAKDYKDRWNIDSDVKVSKRRVVCGSEKLHRLYTNQLKTMVDHYNANVIFWATATN